ncbi:MAG: beta-ketoacyl-[acyl-carrier-protein] synthase family protein [Firmicutes bacterium]|nr:beta-ketoacyl-[acyl-carrier-protein] synthase family protein [[Eubacterium] siraeum]MCM1487730.1 beta-ketoacyl-[acyl-carrier-protein] synthase family protein [Bacillota bacterium]
MSDKNRCVVTGLGLICALGDSVNECWENAVNGISGIRDVTVINTDECYAKKGAVNDTPNSELSSENFDRSSLLCIKAAAEALKDAAIDDYRGSGIGVIVGNCVGGAASIDGYFTAVKEKGEENVPKEEILKMPASAIANNVSSHFGLKGVTANIVNACAAGTISLSYACDLIRSGEAEVFLAGGSDAFTSLAFAGFNALHALDPKACSPFNRSSGITLGEGAGILVIESYEHAVQRGAKIYCEILGSGVSSDAHHITAPRPDGEGQMSAIRRAISNSGLSPKDIDYINAHGTGTAKNDEAEFLSLHTIFDGENDSLSVSSTKSMTGHCLGAAGSIEAVFAVKAVKEGIVPPTTGYTAEDKEALTEKAGKIDFTPNDSRKKPLNYVMSNSFAFGGNNASIIFAREHKEIPEKRCDQPVYITGLGIVSSERGEDGSADSLRAQLTAEDYKAHDIKMAFYRKLDRFSQLQLVSGVKALADAGFKTDAGNENDIGIIIGTSDGPMTEIADFQKNIIEHGTNGGSAFSFPNTVYNAAGGYFSIFSGIKGYNVTVANGWQAGLQSVCYAYNVIGNCEESVMVAAGTDENTDVTAYLYGKYGVKTADKPYGGGSGFVLGEGSVSIVLENEEYANKTGAKKYAEIAGCGMCHGGTDFSEAKVDPEAMKKAVESACRKADVFLEQIDFVSGFGCGIKAIDDGELEVYRELFGVNKPVLSVKAVTGDARAASAAMALAQAARVLSGEEAAGQWFKVTDSGAEASEKPSGSSYALAVSMGAGGSYSAVVIKKV